MELLLILCAGTAGILFGRILMKRWYNHLTIYSCLWTACLALYTLRLIQYYQISCEAWFYIGISWFMLSLGSFTIIFAQAAAHPSMGSLEIGKKSIFRFPINLKFLSRIIIVLSVISSIAIIYTLASVIRTFGNIGAVIVQANLLYRLRVEGEFSTIPYLTSFPLAASCLAGIYTALRRKLTFLSVLPFVLVVLHGIVVMGRTNIVIAGALFLTALLYTPHKRFIKRKTIISLILAIVLAIGGFTFISSIRGLSSYFKYESEGMETMRSALIFLPSLYFYASAPPVTFSEYLYVGEEKFFPGSYTFKPVFNILTKASLADPLPPFNPFISTPEVINAGTYLREIHADFGPLGVMIFPYVVGIILTIFYLKAIHRPTATLVVILAHLSAIVWLSWDINVMKLGQWAVSMLVSLLIALKLDSLAKKRRTLHDN